MNAIYLEPAMVPPALRGSYSGKQFKAYICDSVTIPADAGLWSSGSRDHYSALDVNTGQNVALPGQNAAPWDNSRKDTRVALRPGLAVVRHTMFQGKDLGLSFYVHPDNAAKLLPAPAAELSEYARIVLIATRTYKSSYGGRDRFEIARDDYRGKPYPTRDEWNATKAELIAGGYLNKAGAITVKGRNAIA